MDSPLPTSVHLNNKIAVFTLSCSYCSIMMYIVHQVIHHNLYSQPDWTTYRLANNTNKFMNNVFALQKLNLLNFVQTTIGIVRVNVSLVILCICFLSLINWIVECFDSELHQQKMVCINLVQKFALYCNSGTKSRVEISSKEVQPAGSNLFGLTII